MLDDREARAEAAPLYPSGGMPVEAGQGAFGGAVLWLTGGASLLLWTAIALLLTSA